MRYFACSVAVLFIAAATSSAQPALGRPQQPRPNGPGIPLQQRAVPQLNPNAGQVPVTNLSQLNPGVNGIPGSSVYVPPRYFGNTNVYFINNNNPFGYPAGGFTGTTASSGQFYAVMGGPAPSNPFVSNFGPTAQSWQNATGVGPNGQPWNFPFNYYNFSNPPQFPTMMNPAPVVGQSNGWFPNQPPAPPMPNPNNFGVQMVPGLNAFGR